MFQEPGATAHDGLRGNFEDLVVNVLEKSCTAPPAPNPKKIRHLEVSTLSPPSQNMQPCSRFEDVFLCVERTLQIQQEYMCCSIVEQQAISCRCRQQ